MLGRELLVSIAQRQRLRSLEEPTRAFGEFL
jgi:hypothetical protein